MYTTSKIETGRKEKSNFFKKNGTEINIIIILFTIEQPRNLTELRTKKNETEKMVEKWNVSVHKLLLISL